MTERTFPAPTEELELKLVEFCLNELHIPFGEFWYMWFVANVKGSHCVDILTSANLDTKIISEKFGKCFDVEEIHDTEKMNVWKSGGEAEDFEYLYYINFKLKL